MLPPHQRPMDQPLLDPLLELELELAPGQRTAPAPAAEEPPAPPPPPPPPAAAVPAGEEMERPRPAGRPRASQPVQHLLLNAATRGQFIHTVVAVPPTLGHNVTRLSYHISDFYHILLYARLFTFFSGLHVSENACQCVASLAVNPFNHNPIHHITAFTLYLRSAGHCIVCNYR